MTHPASNSPDCLIFDLFGVVVAFEDELVYQRLASYCSEPIAASREMHDLVSTPSLICGKTPFKTFHSDLVGKYGLNLSLQAFAEIWRESYSEPMPGMRDLLRQLQGQCRLVLLSNIDPFYWSTVEANLPELQAFDALALSFEQGFAKPDLRAFERAVSMSGTNVKGCLFIDDKPENIDAAAQVGIAGHVFAGCANLKQILRTRGLQVR